MTQDFSFAHFHCRDSTTVFALITVGTSVQKRLPESDPDTRAYARDTLTDPQQFDRDGTVKGCRNMQEDVQCLPTHTTTRTQASKPTVARLATAVAAAAVACKQQRPCTIFTSIKCDSILISTTDIAARCQEHPLSTSGRTHMRLTACMLWQVILTAQLQAHSCTSSLHPMKII
jgi:hypothetical protein